MGLLEAQIKAALAIQRTEAALSEARGNLATHFPAESREHMDAFLAYIDSLISISISLGRVKELHENCLKDDQRNTQKEG